jgi:hypothetical protein
MEMQKAEEEARRLLQDDGEANGAPEDDDRGRTGARFLTPLTSRRCTR